MFKIISISEIVLGKFLNIFYCEYGFALFILFKKLMYGTLILANI